MFRFLHTADWQIGAMYTGFGPAAAKLRQARLDAVARLLEVARERAAQAVLVAGDAFEDSQVDATTVQQLIALLNAADRVPIYPLPGNHDPLDRASVYRRPVWRTVRPHIRIVEDCTPIALAEGVVLYPCPLTQKFGSADPTLRIPPRDGPLLRVGLAHGTMKIRPDLGDEYFPIDPAAATRCGLDYLALGHWHSTLSDATGRAWYSGTPETTRHGERDSGHALLVTLAESGAKPQVEQVRTGTLAWHEVLHDLDAAPLDELMRRLRDWPEPARTVLKLELCGQLTSSAAALLPDLLALLAQQFVHARVDDQRLRTATPEDLATSLGAAPYLLATARELQGLLDHPNGGPTPAVTRRALQMLQAFVAEARP